MTAPLSSLTDEQFDALCAGIDAEAEEARRGGFYSGDVLAKGDAAAVEVDTRRRRP